MNVRWLFLLIIFLFSLFNHESNAGIREFCANKWPNDYSMREYCENEQGKANRKLFDIARKKGLVKNDRLSVSPKGGDHEKIIIRCMNKWEKSRFQTYDFTMVVYCIEQQFEAYDKTTRSGTEKATTGIKGFCANKWPNDYGMRDYCENQQIEANGRLFNMAEQYGLVKNGKLSFSKRGNKVERTFVHCINKWEKSRFQTYDFTMVVYCIERQLY